ncbi:hypothetical protein B566_EDAN018223 [Ephemera danica]|nr:hypothetical protein B566_EDAN018223 [Ephemera danica]
MDEDTENVINLIFPTGIPVKEPERLAEEKAAVLEQTQELAFSNYKTFIQTAECSRAIFQQFKETEGRLDTLLERLPRLVEQCQQFGRDAAGLSRRRKACSATLARSTALLELLELPQLMELCVAGQHYEEALQLAAFARRLERRHGEIPAIQGIVKDTQTAWRALLQQLLAQLRTELPLPRCLLLVGLLRRMDIFSEAELRLKFLQARDSWLRALLEAVPRNSPVEHLTRTVELSRQHLFAIITQYRAAFSDDPTGSGGNESAILHGWITEKVSQFIAILEQDISQMGETDPLDSILNQCMYFGLSLARVGADFRALMSPIFVKNINRNFDYMIRKAGKEFETHIEKFNFEKIGSSPQQSQPSSGLQPPQSLLQCPPLALYCNSLLGTFNVLRLCAPLSLAATVTSQLQASLSQAAKTLLARCRQEQHAFTSEEKRGVQRICACFADDLVPHMQRCLVTLYPPATLSAHLAMSVQQLQREGIGVIDKAEVIEPISHLLPVQLEPITLLPVQSQSTEEVEEPIKSDVKAPVSDQEPIQSDDATELVVSEDHIQAGSATDLAEASVDPVVQAPDIPVDINISN